MKTKVHFIILLLVSFCIAEAKTDYSACRGVWSSDNAEAVITDSICIFYCQKDSLMTAYLEIPSAGISSKTTFAKNGTVTTTSDNKPLDFNVLNNNLEILGYSLSKVENIKTVKPYELPQCNSKFDIGRCLQLWRLGGGYGVADDIVYCEINTNRHMFVYMVSPSMTYIRAAAARNCNLGTLFFQNIRMMKNQNTREYTASIQTDNLN